MSWPLGMQWPQLGIVWNDWYDMVNYCMEWYSVLCHIIWNGVVRYGVVWYSVVCYGMVWSGWCGAAVSAITPRKSTRPPGLGPNPVG